MDLLKQINNKIKFAYVLFGGKDNIIVEAKRSKKNDIYIVVKSKTKSDVYKDRAICNKRMEKVNHAFVLWLRPNSIYINSCTAHIYPKTYKFNCRYWRNLAKQFEFSHEKTVQLAYEGYSRNLRSCTTGDLCAIYKFDKDKSLIIRPTSKGDQVIVALSKKRRVSTLDSTKTKSYVNRAVDTALQRIVGFGYREHTEFIRCISKIMSETVLNHKITMNPNKKVRKNVKAKVSTNKK